ncbi:MAG: hypothetical protein ABIP51_07850 [Bacteroidia bacterium]
MMKTEINKRYISLTKFDFKNQDSTNGFFYVREKIKNELVDTLHLIRIKKEELNNFLFDIITNDSFYPIVIRAEKTSNFEDFYNKEIKND